MSDFDWEITEDYHNMIRETLISILNHLRSPGSHWKGCWAVGLFLRENK